MKQRILVWGTFDFIHPGHIAFLKEANKLGNLYVIVVRDFVVKENKGEPVFNENERQKALEKLPFIKKVYIDSFKEGLKSLDEIKPDIFFIGTKQGEKPLEILRRIIKERKMSVIFVYYKEEYDAKRSSWFRNKYSRVILEKLQKEILLNEGKNLIIEKGIA